MDRLIIDASVVTASLLPDEPYHDAALRILARFLRDGLELFTISLLRYELTNALWKGLKLGRVKLEDAEAALREFEAFNIPEVEVSTTAILRLAHTYDRSAYDTAYLTLAEERRIPLITADKRLYRALKDKFQWLIWVEDFK